MSAPFRELQGDPAPGRSYAGVLRGAVAAGFGILLALSAYLLVVPLVAQGLIGLGWVLRGSQQPFSDYYAQAAAYDYPEGVAATHLALGALALISWLVARYWHGLRSHWLWSVQPGMRWRYLLICLVVALVVLNGVLWVSFTWSAPKFGPPQADWLMFAAVILLTSPLQAFAEEVFFRGYLLQAFGALAGRSWLAVVLSAGLFALFHGTQNSALFVDRFAFGLLAGWLVLATGGIEAAVAAHVINNLFAFGYGIFTGGVAATKATQQIGWEQAMTDVVGFGSFAAVAWWVGRRMYLATTTP